MSTQFQEDSYGYGGSFFRGLAVSPSPYPQAQHGLTDRVEPVSDGRSASHRQAGCRSDLGPPIDLPEMMLHTATRDLL